MAKFLILFVFLSFFLVSGQDFIANQVATYNLKYLVGNKAEEEQFVLLINSNENTSYFLSTYNFVKDTIRARNSMELAAMESDFNERVLRKGDSYRVFENIKETRFKYSQTPDLKWKMLPTTKKVNEYTLQLAEINAYGRIWEAWFAKDIQSNAGPYKFWGLPGLIFVLKSRDGVFNFELQRFKQKKIVHALPQDVKYKSIPLKEFNKTRFKIQTADNGVVIFDNAQDRIQWMKGLERRYSNIPLLDSYYPKK